MKAKAARDTDEAEAMKGVMYIRGDGIAIWIGHIDRAITRAEAEAIIAYFNRGVLLTMEEHDEDRHQADLSLVRGGLDG